MKFFVSPKVTIAERLSRQLCPAPERHTWDDEHVEVLSGFGERAITDFRDHPRVGRNKKGESHGARPLKQITALCLHQTAVVFTNKLTALRVQYHALVYPDGGIVLCHHPAAYLWHARKFNRYSIGIAIVCRAAGVEGNLRTFWKPKSDTKRRPVEATGRQLVSARVLARYYLSTLPNIQTVAAHRQSTAMRRSDPGSRIWRGVGCQLGLPPGETLKGGLPLPFEWTGELRDLNYWGRKAPT